MIELALLLSIISILLSVLSVLFVGLKFGISITQEFSERKDVLDKKKNIESAFRRKLSPKWIKLMEKYPMKKELGEDAINDFFLFGIDSYICTLPSEIINAISNLTNEMISSLVWIIVSIFGLGLSYCLFTYEFPLISYDLKFSIALLISAMSLYVVYASAKILRNMIPRIVKLRQTFFRLSELMKIEELHEIYDDLKLSKS